MRVCLSLCLIIGFAACDDGCQRNSPITRDSGINAHDAGNRSKLGSRPLGDGWEVVDPYCGMKLRRAEAAASMEYKGRTYHFCLEDHREAFARDPDRYLSPPEDEGAADGGGGGGDSRALQVDGGD